jgi:hypothetical protein
VIKVTVQTFADRSQSREPDLTSADSSAFFAWLDKTVMSKLRVLEVQILPLLHWRD